MFRTELRCLIWAYRLTSPLSLQAEGTGSTKLGFQNTFLSVHRMYSVSPMLQLLHPHRFRFQQRVSLATIRNNICLGYSCSRDLFDIDSCKHDTAFERQANLQSVCFRSVVSAKSAGSFMCRRRTGLSLASRAQTPENDDWRLGWSHFPQMSVRRSGEKGANSSRVADDSCPSNYALRFKLVDSLLWPGLEDHFMKRELGVRTLLIVVRLTSASFHFATPFYTVSVASRISSANSLQRLEYGVNCSGWNISISLPAKRAGAF